MRKSQIALLSFTLIGVIITFILLKCCFCIETSELWKEALLAAFTGCVFAIPSVLFALVDESKNIKYSQGKLLSDLYKQFNKLSIQDDYRSYRPGELEDARHQISRQHFLIVSNLSENLWSNTPEVRNLLDNIFNFSDLVLSLDGCYKNNRRPTETQFDTTIKEIKEAKDRCMCSIVQIQELL